eukprot:gene8883-9833_t
MIKKYGSNVIGGKRKSQPLLSFIVMKACSVQSLNISFAVQPVGHVSLEGFNAHFNCSAIVSPQGTTIVYLWKYNGIYINTNTHRRFHISPTGSLVISGVTAEDFGTYQCVAQCTEGAIISLPAELEKAVFQTQGSPTSTTYVEKVGVPFFLKALKYESKPPAKVKWKICQDSGSCLVEGNRFLVTDSGDLLIFALLRTDNDYRLQMEISPQFHHTIRFHYGKLSVSGGASTCQNQTVMFYPSQQNFTVSERENVILDCLAVFGRCFYPLTVNWRKLYHGNWMNIQDSGRRYQLSNIGKQNEGVYECYAGIGEVKRRKYFLTVIEKPKLLVEPPSIWSLRSNGLVPFGTVQNATYIKWYTNAERISGDSEYYQVLANNSLRIKFFMKTLSGIYQIFYHNTAGVISRTVHVNIKNTICGGRLTSSNGTISFYNVNDLPPSLVQCLWLIQIPASRYIKLNFTLFDFNRLSSDCNRTSLMIYEGLIKTNASNGHMFCYNKAPRDPIVVAGPYITVSLATDGSQIKNGGFKMTYAYNITVTTAAPHTTSLTSTTRSLSSSSTSTTKPSTTSVTTARTTKQSTKASTSVSTRRSGTTPKTTSNVKSSTAKSIETVTTKLFTQKSTGHRTSKPSTPSTRKGGPKQGVSAVTLGAIGGSAAILIIVIIAAVICHRRRAAHLSGKTSLAKEMTIIGSRGSFNDPRYMKTSTTKAPILNYDGLYSTASETCFTLKERPTLPRSKFPDVIPTSESPYCEMGYLGPGVDSVINEENYAALGLEGSKTIGTKLGQNYATDSNEYQALVCSDSDSSANLSLSSTPIYTSANSNPPLYQTVEREDGGMVSMQDQPTYHVLEGEIIQEPVYNVLEDENAPKVNRDQKFDPSTDYLQPVQPRNQIENIPKRGTMSVSSEPVYNVLEDETGPKVNRDQKFDPSKDYLQPVQPCNQAGIAKRGMPVSDEPVYHVLNDETVVGSSSNGVNQSEAYESLASIQSGITSDDFYQPIEGSNAEYMPIDPMSRVAENRNQNNDCGDNIY